MVGDFYGTAELRFGPDLGQIWGMYSFCQLMTASMPTFIGRNITAIRPTHDCFYANLGHIMTAFMPTIGQIV